MGAANFYTKNASRHFVVLTSYEEDHWVCEECEHVHYEITNECDMCESKEIEHKEDQMVYPESYEYDNFKLNLFRELEENLDFLSEDGGDDERSYYGSYVGKLTKYKMFGDTEVGFSIRVLVRSAYYDGATLDWELLDYEGYEEDLEQVIDTAGGQMDYSDMNEGMKIIQSKNAENWIEKQIEQLIDEVETIFTKFSTHEFRTLGVMSNGVAIYESFS